MKGGKSLFLYDPRTNITTDTNYRYLMELTGLSLSGLSRAKTRGSKVSRINCYISDEFPNIKKRREWYSKEIYPDESWLPLKGTINDYLVSNYGRVKRVYKTSERLMLPYQRKGEGNLWVKIDRKETKVAHLVATLFIRKPKPGEAVIRKNGIITDDYAGNLEYVNKRKLGTLTGYKAKSKPVVQVDLETMEIINEYRSAREAGRKCHFSYQAILDRCNNKHPYRHETVTFMFEENYEKSIKSGGYENGIRIHG